MRTPFGWTQTSQASLQIVCACCLLWSAPAAALAAPEQITTSTAISAQPSLAANSNASNSGARIGGAHSRHTSSSISSVLFDKRVLSLLGMAGVIGLIAGWASGGPRETRFRLWNKPKKTHLSVLVPPGPPPRLIPGDSPRATRARWTRDPIPRPIPAPGTHSRVIHYLAPFADPPPASEETQVDYLLLASDGVEDPPPRLDLSASSAIFAAYAAPPSECDAPMSARRVTVFFYGLFMDAELLRAKGIEPVSIRPGALRDFRLVIANRATLLPSAGSRSYGMLMDLSHEDLSQLYGTDDLRCYQPEAVLAETSDGSKVAALCYNLVKAPSAAERNAEYAVKLRAVLAKVAVAPQDYIDSLVSGG